MATGLSFTESEGDGISNQFVVPFEYIDRAHVHATIDGVEVDQSGLTWPSDGIVQLPYSAASLTGQTVRRYRKTPLVNAIADYTVGGLEPDDLDASFRQLLFIAQEQEDRLVALESA